MFAIKQEAIIAGGNLHHPAYGLHHQPGSRGIEQAAAKGDFGIRKVEVVENGGT